MGVGSAMYIGMSGLNGFGSALAVVSDNIANASTIAFKSNRVRFGDMVGDYYSNLSDQFEREGCGSAILGIDADFSQGQSLATNTWSDLMINGNGFFNVRDPNDPTGKIYYTRDGSFHMDKNGYLVNSQGMQVLDSGGNPLQIEPNPSAPVYTNYRVDDNGQLWGTPVSGGQPTMMGNPLRISTFANQECLIRTGTNLYVQGPESGDPVNGTAGTSPCGNIVCSMLEGSNVELATEMVNMIMYQADYNANSKSIKTGSDMLDTAVNLIR